jgi:hypothetical protein
MRGWGLWVRCRAHLRQLATGTGAPRLWPGGAAGGCTTVLRAVGMVPAGGLASRGTAAQAAVHRPGEKGEQSDTGAEGYHPAAPVGGRRNGTWDSERSVVHTESMQSSH